MEIGMLNFWLPLLVTAQTKENYFNVKIVQTLTFDLPKKISEFLSHIKVKSWPLREQSQNIVFPSF